MAAITTNDIDDIFLGTDHVDALYLGDVLVWIALGMDILFVPDEFEEG